MVDIMKIFKTVKEYKNLCHVEEGKFIDTDDSKKFLREEMDKITENKTTNICLNKSNNIEKFIIDNIASLNKKINLEGYELPYRFLKFTIDDETNPNDAKKNGNYFMIDNNETICVIINQKIKKETYYGKIHINLKEHIIDEIKFAIRISCVQILLKILLIDRTTKFIGMILTNNNSIEQDRKFVENFINEEQKLYINRKLNIFDYEYGKSVRDIIKNELSNYMLTKIENKRKRVTKK
jgi:hypothetical protein